MKTLFKILIASMVLCSSVGAVEHRRLDWRATSAKLAPEVFKHPEGRSRWDASAWSGGATMRIDLMRDGASQAVLSVNQSGTRVEYIFKGIENELAAGYWLFPETDPLAYEASVPTVRRLMVQVAETTEEWRIETRRVGVGWLHLPSGPREVYLQRAIIDVRNLAGEPLRTEQRHRFIDPRAGVVAEAKGEWNSQSGQVELNEVGYAEEILLGDAPLVMYVDQIEPVPGKNILYGWDTGPGSQVSDLTPEMYATIGDLIAANSWDFSGTTSGTEQASITYDLTATETCNIGECGYPAGTNWTLGRRDVDFEGAEPVINNQTAEKTIDGVTGEPTLWLRGARQKEGVTGAFGTGESGTCYTDGRPEVPLWGFPNQDANGWYFQPGDNFTSDPFNCDQVLFNETCGGGGLFSELYADACEDHAGNQTVEVLKEGVVTLPSGHTLNSLLARNTADFCVYTDSFCFIESDQVRTVIYIWQVPNLGSVILLQSEQEAPDQTSWSTLDNTLISFGLFPPLSIQADSSTDSSVTISWNPGNDTRRIKDYVVYWDTDSGAASDYAFNSLTHPGQVSFSGTQATISGLSAGTQYFFTVTSRTDYTSPVSGAIDTIESMLYPTQVSGDPSFVYPVEIQTSTTSSCATSEVQNLLVSKVSATEQEFCWSAISSPCLEGYTIQGANSPESAMNYSVVADVGLVTCWVGSPTETYFIVTGRGGGADWPWGHYGQ